MCCIDSVQRTIEINITPTPIIIGESEVVAHTNEAYRTPSQSSLKYRWEVTSGTIENDPENSEIDVTWGSVGTGTVKLIVTHKTTNCTDSLTLTIAINSTPIDIRGKKTVCSKSEEIYSISASENIEYQWEVAGGSLQGIATDTLVTIVWGEPGTGVITIIRTNTQTQEVDTAVTNINILELPVVGIIGIGEICEGTEEIYIAINTAGVSSEWSAYHGTIIGVSNLDTVYIQWNEIEEGNDSAFVKGTVFLTQTSEVTGCSNTKEQRVSISAKPGAVINGDFSVCENSIEYYSTEVHDISFINEWYVTGGTIIGSSIDTTLEVEWGPAGQGSIKLIQTSSTNCIDSNYIEIPINPLPPKPTINQSGKMLVSSADSGNQWYSEGEEIEGETSQLFSPSQSGYYTVLITDSNDCVSEMSEPYYFDINSVYDFVTSAEIIKIYPNPTNGQFRVIVNENCYSEVTLKLRNIVGTILYENEYWNISGSFDKTLDVNYLPAGVYILQVQIGNDVYNSKIIKY
jgi:hypothetical protein